MDERVEQIEQWLKGVLPLTPRVPRLKLYFAELGGEIHGPMHWRPDERVEQIQQWLEEETFESLCVDEATNACRPAAAWSSARPVTWTTTQYAMVTP